MIVVDYNQTAIGSFMAEARGRADVEPNLPLLRHMIVNCLLYTSPSPRDS